MRRLSTALCATFILAALPGVSVAAVPERRVAHTATLLTNGNILIAGGIKEDGTSLNSAEIVNTSNGNATVATGNIDAAVSRASHTATLLTNGCVLIAGGNIAGSTIAVPSPTNTARLYDPDAGTFSAASNMNFARYNHTATLLNDGRVLICGGQDAVGTAVPGVPLGSGSCELYTAGATCTNVGSFAVAPAMLQARYNHSATLLKDGRVWFAGGRNPAAAATGGYLSTTERFDPLALAGAGAFQSASPLIEARAHHTTTLMGDGKALVVGGYNNRQLLANYGMTESAEIYDPVSNSVTPAAVMAARRMGHAGTLSANGQVGVFGGLGNITTTYFFPTAILKAGSFVNFNAPAAPLASINGTTALLPINFPLSTQVSGEIMDGEIWMSSPSIHPSWGMINFTAATPYPVSAGGVGLRISMNGFNSDCLPDGSKCGIIDVNPASMSLMTGQVIFYRRKDVQNSDSASTSGTMNFVPVTIDSTTPNGVLSAGSSVTTDLTIAMADGLIGSNLKTGTFTFKSGTVIRGNGFTVTITGAAGGNIAGTFPIVADANGSGTTNVTVVFNTLVGTIKYDANSGSLASGSALGAADKVNITADMIYTTDGANLNTEQFTADIATVVVRKMIFSDMQTYTPKTNSWVLAPPPGSSPSDHRYGHSATLLPNNDTVFYGGRSCGDATCTTTAATVGIKRTLLFSEANFVASVGASSQKRAFHTSTLLPNAKILVAGGTNGPSILSNAELFTPDTGLFSAVNGGGMRYVRDLHTATLMPNGRVLIAGGFTTNAASTGSTNTAEIYYPDVNRFIETSPMISSRSNHSAILLPDGRIFVAGGFGDLDVITGTSEIFLSTANRWMPVAAMDTITPGCQRAIHATVQLKSGKIMLIGGVNASGPLDTSAIYDPNANTWDCTSVTLMPTPLRSHTATLLFDGRVLVAGGNDGLGEANKSFIYDPVLNTWTATHATPLLQPRFNHTATLLPNGTVMISGGSQKFGNVPLPIETYHVNASSWVTGAVAFAAGPRAFHTMTLALNNTMVGIGGSDGVIGGVGSNLYTKAEVGYFTATPDSLSKNSPPSFRQSTITVVSPLAIFPNLPITVTGNQFRGGTEASGGGAASANSSFSYPHLVLQQVDGSGGAASQSNGGFVVDLTTMIFRNPANLATLNTSLTVDMPPTSSSMPFGWYTLRAGANDVYSEGKFVQVGPTKPLIAPTVLTGVAAGISTMTWSWNTDVGIFNGYNVYNATTGVIISSIPVSLTSRTTFYQTGLDPGATTSILVAGYTLLGDSPLTSGPTVYTLSTCPVNVTIASVTFSDLLLYWGSNGNSSPGTIYEVTQSSDNFITDVSTPLPKEFGQTGFFTTIPNLLPNTTYFFRVQAFNLVGLASTYSAVKSTQTRAGVNQPIVSGRATSTIDWAWTPASGASSYRVYNATSGVRLDTPGPLVTAPSFTEVGMGTNTLHSIRVSAVTVAGEGPLSPSASAYTSAASPGPFNPRIAQLTTGSFLLNWTLGGNPPGTIFQIIATEFDVNGASVAVATQTTSGLPLSVGFGGLIPSTRYDWSIIALNGDSIPSDSPPTVVGTTWTIPNVPSTLVVDATDPTNIYVSWLKNNNASSATYEVLYSTDNFVLNIATAIAFSNNFGGSASTLTLTVSATIPNLVTGSSYSIKVAASNPFGQISPFSNIVTTRTSNGGGAIGSLGGTIFAVNNSALVGSIGSSTSTHQVNIRVPARTFPGDVNITLSTWSVINHPGALDCSGGASDMGFEISDTPALQPTGSLFFTFSFTPLQLGTIPAARALLMRFDPGSRTCVPLETTVDTTSGQMTARINHFSQFQVGQVPLATTAETARLFPNPFYAGRDGYVTLDNVPPGARVRIFTLRGEQVLDVKANSNGILTWSGTNGAGRTVASGVYLVMIESGGTKKILKLAVIR